MTDLTGTTGILHPGAMGSSIGGALTALGSDVVWLTAGRGDATVARAGADGLRPVDSMAELVEHCDLLVSVCPPVFAQEVAQQVSQHDFAGTYVDANAVSPATSRVIAEVVTGRGATFVDGGIVGPPARFAGVTVLYLSGPTPACEIVQQRFDGSLLATHVVGAEPGAASAVKMAFAAWTKGTSALLLAIRALAEAEDVVDGLAHAWSVLTPDLPARLAGTAAGTAPKAWRFVGEMEEIASTFAAVGLPSGFHDASAEIYDRLADLRDFETVTIDDVVERLIGRPTLLTPGESS